ncbi:probable carboxylesterase 12 [Aegilops tauschii subsp. strangulata]|uniref:Alpha/beta hydrolase fold-3 domain-containing protein n=1 Tax=Aegilops tauschii subsp. strangulata TaxID=200361 RepID=A0A453CDV5_AEGTS|nr:probable carboxylesterase 12 [Aegilops tauschii subsp. strangulata]
MAGSISSALLLLLNMAGALLAPSASAPQSLPASADDDGDVDFFFFPFLVRYKSGRVERFVGTDTVPASLEPATGVASKDAVIDAAAGLAVRLYLPSLGNSTRTRSGRGDRLPLVVFYHGGGFVTESAFSPTYQRYLNALASKAGALVVSVDYHLSPEHPLPAAYDDAWAALRWVLGSARSGAEPWLSRRADLTRLLLVGDSAGGNIAHNMAMRAGREGLDGGAAIKGIALLDPYFWGKRPVPSETRDPEDRRLNDRIWSFVCAGRYGADDPVVNPVAMAREEWRRLGCARVLVTVAGLDVLSARGRAYVEELRASGWGGEVRLYETPGENHVYFLLQPDGEKAAKEMDAVVAFINGDRSPGGSKPEGSAKYTNFLGTLAEGQEKNNDKWKSSCE